MNNIYNIVVVADEGYIQHTAVMLCSLFNTNKDKCFRVFFLTTGISDENTQRISELCNEYASSLEVMNIPLDSISDLPCGMWTTFIYLKLFMPTVLPADANRCMFLDGDMVINDDIEALYNIDLGKCVIAAAVDNPDGETHKQRLGLQPLDVYINSGVMVCNLKKWRQMENERSIFDYTRSIASVIMNEQDVIAKYFQGKITVLPIRWNMVTHYFLRKPKIYDKYLGGLKDAKQHPGIIHFCAPIKPWFKDCDHPYRFLYKRYLRYTTWSDYSFPFYENISFFKRIKKRTKILLDKIGVRHEIMALTLK